MKQAEQKLMFNMLFSIIPYALFRESSDCKFRQKCYGMINLKQCVQIKLMYYIVIDVNCNDDKSLWEK